MTDRPSAASTHLGQLVARIRRLTLARGRIIWTGYDDFGRQIVAVPADQEPEAFDVYLRDTPTSIAQAEDRLARRARKRSLRGIKAAICNMPTDSSDESRGHSRSQKARKEARAREVLLRLSPIPQGGDELGSLIVRPQSED